jgi:lipoprotein NlpI
MMTMRFSATLIATVLVAGAGPALAADREDGLASYPGDDARSGYIQLVRLDAKDPTTTQKRSPKDQVKSELNQIIVYYNAAIKHDPKDDDAYFHRGVANYYAGAFPQALADLGRASKLDPEYAYYALWIDIVEKRNGGAASLLPQAIAHINMSKWPAPVIHMYLGEATPADVLAAADDHDATTKKGQLCEANFYIGELALQKGDKAEATRLFRLAATGCAPEFVEGPSARAELEALDGSE